MSFNVTKVIDGDTFEVSPNWKWGDDKKGNRVRIAGFDAAEADTKEGKKATQQLKDLIEGEDVELKNPGTLSYGRLVCDVYLNGENIVE